MKELFLDILLLHKFPSPESELQIGSGKFGNHLNAETEKRRR